MSFVDDLFAGAIGVAGFKTGVAGFATGVAGFATGVAGFATGVAGLETGIGGFETGVGGFETGVGAFPVTVVAEDFTVGTDDFTVGAEDFTGGADVFAAACDWFATGGDKIGAPGADVTGCLATALLGTFKTGLATGLVIVGVFGVKETEGLVTAGEETDGFVFLTPVGFTVVTVSFWCELTGFVVSCIAKLCGRLDTLCCSGIAACFAVTIGDGAET